ncbi:MAG: hypothetical protein O2894_04055, partial [Planctomycetota bacterium]|nr:hypothetical protein [Planctomycetota bacterium]
PALLRRPHRELLRGLTVLGARLKRRSSGAVRVLGGGLRHGARLTLDLTRSSQYASALLLIAPRIGGLTLDLRGGGTSRAYLDLTLATLGRFGIEVTNEPTAVHVAAGEPHAAHFELEGDASAAAAWWTAAALSGGEARVEGIPVDSPQADVALLGILKAYGARVEATHTVRAPAGALRAPTAPVDLTRTPDLLFLVGALAARAEGVTHVTGIAHTRGKESDRIAVLQRGLEALGVAVEPAPDDGLRIRGGGARAGLVRAEGDHRAALGFGVLGLAVPGVVVAGAQAVAKSQPAFWSELAAVACPA